MSQSKLLTERRFAPFFATQFLGALNDNLFKNALMITVAYRSMSLSGLGSEELVAMAAGLFILPFFLFSAWAGQLADKLSKSLLIRWVKAAEIGIMLVAGLGFWLASLPILLSVLFLMGLQSAVFGPVKYSILPELVRSSELTGGNALVETGTFIAILLGTIGGGLLAAQDPHWVGPWVVSLALLGYLASRRIPSTPAGSPSLQLSRNPIEPALQTYRATRAKHSVFLSVLAISWFWFVGASFLTVLPTFGKSVLGANEQVVTLFLSLFCLGVAFGALLCEKLGGKKLELGLVPFGSLGISIAAADLYFASKGLAPASDALLGLSELARQGSFWRIGVDFFLLALFGALFTVPLYTLIQERSDPVILSRVIAGNNILNALFMVGSAILLMALPALGLSIPQVFLLMAVANALVAVYVYSVVPEFMLRFFAWILAKLMYRIQLSGPHNLPEQGPAVLVANHVSFIDWLLISSVYQRPIRFVMHHGFLQIPVVGFLFRDAKVIPIASAKQNAGIMHAAFDQIATELEAGEVVCIFPEGRLCPDGELQSFRPGIQKVIERTPVPVVPIAISGMWGSFFSRKDGKAFQKPFRRFWSRIRLSVGEPVSAEQVTPALLEARVAALASTVTR